MNFDVLETQLDSASRQVFHGMALWKKIKDELKISRNSCVLLFPSSERDINEAFLTYMGQLAECKQYESIYVLSPDVWTMDNAVLFSEKVAGTRRLSEYESDCLMKYYSLIEFSNRFYVCAITKPEGRLGELLTANEIPMDEIVCAGVYRIYDYEKVS